MHDREILTHDCIWFGRVHVYATFGNNTGAPSTLNWAGTVYAIVHCDSILHSPLVWNSVCTLLGYLLSSWFLFGFFRKTAVMKRNMGEEEGGGGEERNVSGEMKRIKVKIRHFHEVQLLSSMKLKKVSTPIAYHLFTNKDYSFISFRFTKKHYDWKFG